MPTAPALDPLAVLGVPREALPRHVAIIMDGNGRWARQRGLPRVAGHEAGSRTVREIITECARLGVECLTLYMFSQENWKRPRAEVDALMELCRDYLVKERGEIMANAIRIRHVGRRERLPESLLRELDETVAMSRQNGGMTLCLALNYGSRREILDAIRALAEDVRRGTIAPQQIDEAAFAARLYTAGLPDPDLIIRTAGQMRLSNFLLWQLSYAELHVTDTLWPDFGRERLHAALRDFAGRERRYGDVSPPGERETGPARPG